MSFRGDFWDIDLHLYAIWWEFSMKKSGTDSTSRPWQAPSRLGSSKKTDGSEMPRNDRGAERAHLGKPRRRNALKASFILFHAQQTTPKFSGGHQPPLIQLTVLWASELDRGTWVAQWWRLDSPIPGVGLPWLSLALWAGPGPAPGTFRCWGQGSPKNLCQQVDAFQVSRCSCPIGQANQS